MFWRIEDFYRRIRYWFKWNFSKERFQLIKEVIIGDNFDYANLLRIERLKLKEMYKYYQKVWWIETNTILRDLRICISLLDYILEFKEIVKVHNEDLPPSKWEFECTKYVNPRNAYRFFCDEEYSKKYPDSLYIEKALYLYHKIRSYNLQTWWD